MRKTTLHTAGFGLVLIGGTKTILSPVLIGASGIAAAGMAATNMGAFALPGLMLLWYGEELAMGAHVICRVRSGDSELFEDGRRYEIKKLGDGMWMVKDNYGEWHYCMPGRPVAVEASRFEQLPPRPHAVAVFEHTDPLRERRLVKIWVATAAAAMAAAVMLVW